MSVHLAARRDAAPIRARTKVLYFFGREDHLDVAGVKRLVDALSRLLDPADALAPTAPAGLFVCGVPAVGWGLAGRRAVAATRHRQGRAGSGGPAPPGRRRRTDPVRLVANRALKPSSKLAASEWACHDVHLPGLDYMSDDACYRAIDDLLRGEQAVPQDL